MSRKIKWIAIAVCVGLGLLAAGALISSFDPSFADHKRLLIDGRLDFERLPLEKRIETSSVILLTKWKEDGDRLRGVIIEILKRDSKVSFYYKVGDMYRKGVPIKPNTDYGDGQVMFFEGSPPQLTFGASYSEGRISAFGDMPLTTFRTNVEASVLQSEKESRK